MMQVAVFGINLEQGHILASEPLIAKIRSFLPHFDIIPLVTCNRFEIYINAPENGFLHRVFYELLRNDLGSSLLDKSYLYFSYDCFYHLCATTSGLNSAIFGESEIQRQVKISYLNAAKNKLPYCLHFLFQKALKIGKDIRTSFQLQNKSPKLAAFIWNEVKLFYKNPSILFVGNSQINKGVRSFFEKNKLHRNITTATRFPVAFDRSISFEELCTWSNYDVVVCASKANQKLIKPLKARKKIFVFDLSSQEVVDPKVAESKNVFFWPLHKINSHFSKQKKSYNNDIEKCLNEVSKQVEVQKSIFEKKERNRRVFQKKAS